MINWFLLTPDDASIRWMVRSIGTIIPLAALGLLFALPPELLYDWTRAFYPH